VYITITQAPVAVGRKKKNLMSYRKSVKAISRVLRFLEAMSGYRLIDLRRSEDIRVREELHIVDKNSRIKDHEIK
jgi:hypothetical protein